MFEVRTPQPTDQDLVELLAAAGMGWQIHNVSRHRPGSRDVPHAWRWNRDRVRIMVYLGGEGPQANVEFDPLGDPACTAELAARLKAKDIDVGGWDLNTAEGRRSTCQHAAERLKATQLAEAEKIPPPPITGVATITAHSLPEGESFPPAAFVARDKQEDQTDGDSGPEQRQDV